MTEIAVVRALALGDMLCAVPALRALRALHPDAHIALVGLPWARELVTRFSDYLDEHIEFPGWPGIPEVACEPARTLAFLEEMQGRRFDLVVQLQGNGLSMNEFVALFGASRVAGFVPPGLAAPSGGPDDTWVTYPAHGHEVDRLLTLAEALGAPAPVDRRLEFPMDAADVDELERVIDGEVAADDPIAVVHAGGSRPDRRWPADRFAAVADELARSGLRIALTGTATEADVTREVAGVMSAPAIDLAGRTSLGAVAALVDRARVVLTNDTGISHLAAALGTDSVTVFSASDPERWAPVGTGRHLVVGVGRPEGSAGRVDVKVEEVSEAVRSLVA